MAVRLIMIPLLRRCIAIQPPSPPMFCSRRWQNRDFLSIISWAQCSLCLLRFIIVEVAVLLMPQNWPPSPTDSTGANIFNATTALKLTYKVSMGIGFNVAFGINFKLTNRLRLFTELFGNFSALKPKSSISSFEEINTN